MFQVKICGVTRVEDALSAAAAGADAVGLNFYAPSPRCVALPLAEEIVARLPAGVAKVGVFVNADLETICGSAVRLGLDYLQLHGDETPAFLARLRGRRVVRAFRCGAQGLAPLREMLDECRRLDALPAAVLVDAWHPQTFGGTGQVADWAALAGWPEVLAGLPLILAGGLGPVNVAEAIRAVRPGGVDTASGVEAAPGVKDPALVAAFVTRARAALQAG